MKRSTEAQIGFILDEIGSDFPGPNHLRASFAVEKGHDKSTESSRALSTTNPFTRYTTTLNPKAVLGLQR